MEPSTSNRAKTKALIALLCVLVALVGATQAGAGTLASSAAPCATQFGRPFLPWLDPMQYFLVPGGSLESTAGWTLAGGAKLVEGNEPWKVASTADHRSLSLPSGSSATTRAMCVTIDSPTVRFFAVNGGATLTTLKVEALTEDRKGAVRSTLVGVLAAGSRWQPTLPLTFSLSQLVPWLLTGQTTAVAFRFTPLGPNSGWLIDDVYVDPFRSR